MYKRQDLNVLTLSGCYSIPLSIRYIRGSELVQKLTAVAFDMVSECMTLQEWYAYQVQNVPVLEPMMCSFVFSATF